MQIVDRSQTVYVQCRTKDANKPDSASLTIYGATPKEVAERIREIFEGRSDSKPTAPRRKPASAAG